MSQKRVVVITGAANGIGKGVAKVFAENNDRVVIADVVDGSILQQEIEQAGQEAIFIQTDVRDPKSIGRLFQQVEELWGRVDVLINNAGVSRFAPFEQLTVEVWEDVIQTNLRGAMLCAQAASKLMKKKGIHGSIVNMASTRAIMSEPNSEAYAATKGGLVALTHALAATLSEARITVNAISPGWIETRHYDTLRPIDHEQHLSKRVGTPEDIARACLYLTDPQNNFVTGINHVVDGGMTRKMIYEE
ncbi:SDR family oxidoreductase [Pullulanibacillus sp. KACC 23026]|uniref:SDR family NAD(P)-dependent oxidoreductase n=1 Tax=Pullulanibacillus sp. KACC 23026 TaxID=3028315 RepID=UPI0023B12D81|nr:SDR family oxidoreductase [Pullulanibacillus sp. KACC 23026]WEG13043.1 SDR family oxidoreductase [Pullulanibacillus sp. KACC 23026]